MLFDGLVHRDVNLAPDGFVEVVRDQALDRVAHDVDELDPGKVPSDPGDRVRVGRELGVMRARLAAEGTLVRPLEEPAIPVPAFRVDVVVAEEVRLLGPAHEEPWLAGQLLMERARGAFHRADDDEIRPTTHRFGTPAAMEDARPHADEAPAVSPGPRPSSERTRRQTGEIQPIPRPRLPTNGPHCLIGI